MSISAGTGSSFPILTASDVGEEFQSSGSRGQQAVATVIMLSGLGLIHAVFAPINLCRYIQGRFIHVYKAWYGIKFSG